MTNIVIDDAAAQQIKSALSEAAQGLRAKADQLDATTAQEYGSGKIQPLNDWIPSVDIQLELVRRAANDKSKLLSDNAIEISKLIEDLSSKIDDFVKAIKENDSSSAAAEAAITAP